MNAKRFVLRLLLTLLICTIVGLTALAGVIYNTFTWVEPECRSLSENFRSFTPAHFLQEGFDTSPYWMEDYEIVHFPSRDTHITLTGFYIPTNNENAPAVIIVHGYQSCKNAPNSLLPAGILHRNGFNVLLIDLRNMGNSDSDNGRMAGGTKEYKDVLGAWDWLALTKQIPLNKIGLFGYSLGGASVLIAMSKETEVTAAWVDSSYADTRILIDDLLNPFNLQALVPLGLVAGKFVSGDDIGSIQPLDAIPSIAGRPVYLVHGTADQIVPIKHAYLLANELKGVGSLTELWVTQESQHVSSMFDYPSDYESRLVKFFKSTIVD